jgi:hypothetical protein
MFAYVSASIEALASVLIYPSDTVGESLPERNLSPQLSSAACSIETIFIVESG